MATGDQLKELLRDADLCSSRGDYDQSFSHLLKVLRHFQVDPRLRMSEKPLLSKLLKALDHLQRGGCYCPVQSAARRARELL